MADTWPKWLEKAEHVAQAADWVRWKSQDRVRVVIALGATSVAVAKARDIDPEIAISLLEEAQETIARALRDVHDRRLTNGHSRLPDR